MKTDGPIIKQIGLYLLSSVDQVGENVVHLLDKLLVLRHPVLQRHRVVQFELLAEVRVDNLQGDEGSIQPLLDAAFRPAFQTNHRGPVGQGGRVGQRHLVTLHQLGHALYHSLHLHFPLVRLQLLIARTHLAPSLALASHLQLHKKY
jgi:hypothetical protein